MRVSPRVATLLVMLALHAGHAAAAVHCVHDEAGLAAALGAADDNGQHDEVRLRRGSYEASAWGQFQYLAADDSEVFDIAISGDWNAGCSLQGNNPFATVIDGNGVSRGLTVWLPGGLVSVRLLSFVGGVTIPGSEHGGGLGVLVTGDDATSIVRIERNLFIGNEALFGGGLGVSGGSILQVVNNVFVANTAEDNHAAGLVTDSGAVYFANNTVVANDASAGSSGSALYVASVLGAMIVNNNFHGNEGRDLSVMWDPDEDPVNVLRNNNIHDYSIGDFPVVEDNIDVVPEYQSGFLNFTPVRNSPLVDAGVAPTFLAFWYLTDLDMNASPREVGPHVDIGAFENEKIFDDGFETPGPFGLPRHGASD
jgi:hypothetical protein